MAGNKLDEFLELVDLLKEIVSAERDMERADLKVRIKFAGAGASAADLALARQMIAGSAAANLPGAGAPPAAATAAPAAEPEEKLHEVKSPIVGTFYESP